MCALGTSNNTSTEPTHTLVAILTTLCNTHRDDFLIYNHKTQKIGLWQRLASISNRFWCLPDHPIDHDKLQRALMKYYDKYQLIYDESRLIPRDTKYPSDFQDKRKASKSIVDEVRQLWTIRKGPRAISKVININIDDSNQNGALVNRNSTSDTGLFSRNKRLVNQKTVLTSIEKAKITAEIARKQLVAKLKAKEAKTKKAADVLQEKSRLALIAKITKQQQQKNPEKSKLDSTQSSSHFRDDDLYRNSSHQHFRDDDLYRNSSNPNTNNFPVYSSNYQKTAFNFDEAFVDIQKSKILNDQLAENEFQREKKRKEDAAKKESEDFYEEVKRQNFQKNSIRQQKVLDSDEDLRLAERKEHLLAKEREKSAELEKSKRSYEHEFEKSTRALQEAAMNSNHLRALEMKDRDEQYEKSRREHEISMMKLSNSHTVNVISARQKPTIMNLQMTSSSKKRTFADMGLEELQKSDDESETMDE
jgi:hypothetical protein